MRFAIKDGASFQNTAPAVTVLPFVRPAVSAPCFVRVRAAKRWLRRVRLRHRRPGLTVELILPSAAFEEFCATHRVRHLSAVEEARVDADQAKWRYGRPGITQ
jgi:phenol hydroxylase P0 protein